MEFETGYVYHIKDDYFAKAQDNRLMQNKENGSFRPTYYCMKDPVTSLLWVVPMSTRMDKFQAIHDKQVNKYGNCLTIVLGEFDGVKAAFLLQNMFPITERYLDHIHTRNGNPVPVKHILQQQIAQKMKQVLLLQSKGHRLVFPDVDRLKSLMLEELQPDRIPLPNMVQPPEAALKQEHTHGQPVSVLDRLTAAKEQLPAKEASTTPMFDKRDCQKDR